eukprot:3846485-Rhodomonas_salina.1
MSGTDVACVRYQAGRSLRQRCPRYSQPLAADAAARYVSVPDARDLAGDVSVPDARDLAGRRIPREHRAPWRACCPPVAPASPCTRPSLRGAGADARSRALLLSFPG